MNPIQKALWRFFHGLLFVSLWAFSAIGYASRNDTLVIVNVNSVDSVLVGTHYATKRSIPNENIVHIRTPNQYFISWTQFHSLRDQILRFGICPSVQPELRPSACSDATQPLYTEANVNALLIATPIRYIVTTRGVPTRLQVEPPDTSPYGDSFPPVDNYLRFWLARYIATDSRFTGFNEREISFGNGSGMRNIVPSDREYAVGRIDGVSAADAMALIDRSVAAEENGIFGKLFGAAQGDGGLNSWINSEYGTSIYPGNGATWRYLLGTFNESRPECSDYLNASHYLKFGQSTTQGRSPESCLAQFNKGGGEAAPAHPSSRQPMPVDALMYIGSIDGQTLDNGFDQLLNWRRAKECVTLCSQTSDPVACKATSLDSVKEINTSCVGVVPGFIGYQHQSFPVSHLGIWPTGWIPQVGGGGKMDVPRVDETRGYDDQFSLWFDRVDEIAEPQCPVYSNGVLADTLQSCRANRILALRSVVTVSGNNGVTPPTYQLQFRYKAEDLKNTAAFKSGLIFVYPKAAGVACLPGLAGQPSDTACTFSSWVNHSLPVGSSDGWVLVNRALVTPPVNSDGWNFNAIRLELAGTLPNGNLGFDTISLTDVTANTQLLANGSFAKGHHQTGAGDYAALFLGRLGGTAFWGSTSHHFTNGHAFERNALSTLVYFMRGLPLGEAVWFGDDTETGMLYGDPLYSPIAVRINPQNKWNVVVKKAALPLFGSTINGRGTSVSTNYSVHYCEGKDQYLCGSALNPWRPIGTGAQPGKFVDQSLAVWDTSALPFGDYTLRLSVTSVSQAESQTFNDFLVIRFPSPTDDSDGDGLLDINEIETYNTNPDRLDTDKDGLSDSLEISLNTDPNRADSDGDGVLDGYEDSDGDGYSNLYEIQYGGDPANINAIPFALIGEAQAWVYVETGIPYSYQFQTTWPGSTYHLEIGKDMSLSPDGLLTWTPSFSVGQVNRLVSILVTHPNIDEPLSYIGLFAVTYGNTGDINEDGSVDVADIALLQRHLLGQRGLTTRQVTRADLSPNSAPDGVLDVADLQALIRKVLEK